MWALGRNKRLFERKKSKKRIWVHRIFPDMQRHVEFQRLDHDLRLFDSECFFKNFPLFPLEFEELISQMQGFALTKSINDSLARR